MNSIIAVMAALFLSAEPSRAVAPPELGYRVVEDFFQVPAHWNPGEASAVAVDSKGHIWLFRRASPMLSEFDGRGKFLRSLPDALFEHPHGLRIDRDDNLWTTDDGNHTVLKLRPTGKVLVVLGRRGSGAEANWLFNKPADVAFGRNGDVYVADGYGNSRIVRFDREGRFIKAWGRYGTEPSQFNLPHTIVVGPGDRIYVGDRENQRIQVFDLEGNFIAQWTGVGYPYGLVLTPEGRLLMADGGFDRIVELDETGKIVGALGAPGHGPGQFAWAHFLALTSDRKLIVADVLNWRFQVFVPAPPSGKPSAYVPSERQFWGSKPSEGYVSHAQ
jgi:DNA-binding beta-propeller fold protein YncE